MREETFAMMQNNIYNRNCKWKKTVTSAEGRDVNKFRPLEIKKKL